MAGPLPGSVYTGECAVPWGHTVRLPKDSPAPVRSQSPVSSALECKSSPPPQALTHRGSSANWKYPCPPTQEGSMALQPASLHLPPQEPTAVSLCPRTEPLRVWWRRPVSMRPAHPRLPCAQQSGSTWELKVLFCCGLSVPSVPRTVLGIGHRASRLYTGRPA